jgi:hypothetical protein
MVFASWFSSVVEEQAVRYFLYVIVSNVNNIAPLSIILYIDRFENYGISNKRLFIYLVDSNSGC